MSIINIAITDDDALIVNLLRDFISLQENFNVVFTAGSGEELFSLLKTSEAIPDILLLDLNMKGMNGIEVTQQLKAGYPSVRVIVISSHYQRSSMGFMLKTGVSAFLPKGISTKELVEIIENVMEKGFYFLPDQMEVLREQISSKAPQPVLEQENTLSEREVEVLRLICQQKTAKEIGELLFITQRTVEGHKNNLFVKTGAKNIAGLAIYAIQRNIMRVEDLPVI